MASVMQSPVGQLRGASGAAQLRALRPAGPARVGSKHFSVAASAARRAAAAAPMAPASEGSQLVVPVGRYCESHYKAIRRPTR